MPAMTEAEAMQLFAAYKAAALTGVLSRVGWQLGEGDETQTVSTFADYVEAAERIARIALDNDLKGVSVITRRRKRKS